MHITDIHQLKRGTQIAYVPMHADGNIQHRDVEFGFVTSIPEHRRFIFCRYWRQGHLGELRTKANSEGTPIEYLEIHSSVDKALVEKALAEHC
jgi:hypothetical protein